MSRQFFLFERPRRFIVGTVGVPGERTFYLQASDGARVVSVALEKSQVAILADRMAQLLNEVTEVLATEGLPVDNEALEQPVEEEFRVAAMGLAWDRENSLVIIEAQAPHDDPEIAEQTLLADVEDGPDALRVLLAPADARAFVQRSRLVVSAGRPPCPLCGLPLDSDGHICPRQNGYHRRIPLSGDQLSDEQ